MVECIARKKEKKTLVIKFFLKDVSHPRSSGIKTLESKHAFATNLEQPQEASLCKYWDGSQDAAMNTVTHEGFLQEKWEGLSCGHHDILIYLTFNIFFTSPVFSLCLNFFTYTYNIFILWWAFVGCGWWSFTVGNKNSHPSKSPIKNEVQI